MSTYNSSSVSLQKYLSDVNTGKIQIPQFQRDFVWSKSSMIKLDNFFAQKLSDWKFFINGKHTKLCKKNRGGCG